ncbi:helix-turn-helix domain-containing protein [Spongiivirga citrea]|uniref:Helix-turn-helix domain-containing protein n=1 Tax=Spongiivirga citrea TaxID=1481457 RepID=A0A6M0CS47_9FLAO|nr:helix-turn-helix domain-containing protein [Spongiivirga citrea]NER18317.1 helix-turn-helix domain-containing protein [Spongiivirga citrea]
MGTTFFKFLLIAGAVQGFIFNIASFFSDKKSGKTVLYLNLVVFFLSLNNLQAWLIESGYVSSNFFIKYLLVPWYMPMFPMFYVFLLNYLNIEKKLKTFLIFTMTLFAIELVVRFSVITYLYNFSDEQGAASLMKQYNNVEEIINAIFCVFIFIKALTVVFKKQNLYQHILEYDDIKWIKNFVKLGGVIVGAWLLAIVMNNTVSGISAPHSYYPLRLGSSILLYWIGYQGMFRYILTRDRMALRKRISVSDSIKKLVAKEASTSIIAEKQVEATETQKSVFKRINDFVKDSRCYLNPKLNQELLAEELSMSTSQLSLHINMFSDFNFSDYINNYRVNQAKKLLTDTQFKQYTILSIGLECGFNSRSTFYAAFKKFTGQTPTIYRANVNS